MKTIDDIKEYLRNENEKYIATTSVFDRIIDLIKWHKKDINQNIKFYKKIRKIIQSAKSTIYISSHAADDFISGENLSVDVLIKNDRLFQNWKWVFVVDSKKATEIYESEDIETDDSIININDLSKEDFWPSHSSSFFIESFYDCTNIKISDEYITKDILEKTIQKWIKVYFERNLLVKWVNNV